GRGSGPRLIERWNLPPQPELSTVRCARRRFVGLRPMNCLLGARATGKRPLPLPQSKAVTAVAWPPNPTGACRTPRRLGARDAGSSRRDERALCDRRSRRQARGDVVDRRGLAGDEGLGLLAEALEVVGARVVEVIAGLLEL